METVWIIGAGRFGLHALNKLSERHKNSLFTLVDPVRKNLENAERGNCILKQSDGPAFLNKHLHSGNKPDWIIPALPVHLVAEWLLLRLGDRFQRVPVPSEIDSLLPNPIRGVGDIYVTHATFRCPDDCAEPRNICTVTQRSRKPNMFDLLKDVALPSFRSLVIRSRQLGPGIGGYTPGQLFEMLTRAEESKTAILVSTACRCHGVITGLSQY